MPLRQHHNSWVAGKPHIIHFYELTDSFGITAILRRLHSFQASPLNLEYFEKLYYCQHFLNCCLDFCRVDLWVCNILGTFLAKLIYRTGFAAYFCTFWASKTTYWTWTDFQLFQIYILSYFCTIWGIIQFYIISFYLHKNFTDLGLDLKLSLWVFVCLKYAFFWSNQEQNPTARFTTSSVKSWFV